MARLLQLYHSYGSMGPAETFHIYKYQLLDIGFFAKMR
jgi:hypothetical protein